MTKDVPATLITDPRVQGLVDQLGQMNGVVAVSLGGSRVVGNALPSSDWDLGVYYRGHFDADQLRKLGWPGLVAGPGDWGRLMNGGAWLTVDGVKVDVLLRDLDVVNHWTGEARAGRFEVDQLHGYLAGLPTYSLTAELAIGSPLVGKLPRPVYPEALKVEGDRYWSYAAAFSLRYAERYAASGEASNCCGAIARAGVAASHARLAASGTWVLNEKGILDRAGLRGLDAVFLGASSGELVAKVAVARVHMNLHPAGPGLPPDAVVRR